MDDSDFYEEEEIDIIEMKPTEVRKMNIYSIPSDILNDLNLIKGEDPDFYLPAIHDLTVQAPTFDYRILKFFDEEFFEKLIFIFIGKQTNLQTKSAIIDLVIAFCKSNKYFSQKLSKADFQNLLGNYIGKNYFQEEKIFTALYLMARDCAVVFNTLNLEILKSLLDHAESSKVEASFIMEPLWIYMQSNMNDFKPSIVESIYSVCSLFFQTTADEYIKFSSSVELAIKISAVVIEKETKGYFAAKIIDNNIFANVYPLIGVNVGLTEAVLSLYISLCYQNDAKNSSLFIDKMLSSGIVSSLIILFSPENINDTNINTLSYLWCFLYNVLLEKDESILTEEEYHCIVALINEKSINGPYQVKKHVISFISLLISKMSIDNSIVFALSDINFIDDVFENTLSQGYSPSAAVVLVAMNALMDNARRRAKLTNSEDDKSRLRTLESHLCQDYVTDVCEDIIENNVFEEKRISEYILETIHSIMDGSDI